MLFSKEPPVLEEMFLRLQSLKSQFTSRREYEAAVRLIWSGIPEQVARERVSGSEIRDKDVYEFDPISLNVLRAKPIKIWESVLSVAEEHIEKVLARSYSFLFYGANGSGKTHSAIQFLCTAIESGYSGYYISLRDLYLLFNEVSFKEHSQTQADLLAFISTVDVLVLDEVGKETLSGPVISYVEDLLKTRSTKPCSTIICSNIQVHKKEFLTRYGNSVWDIIRGNYFVYHFSADGDFRKQFRKTLDLS